MGDRAHQFVFLGDDFSELVARVLQFRMGADPGEQLRGVKRFGDEIDRPLPERLGGEVDLIRGGEENNGDIHGLRVRLQLPANFQAVHSGLHQVELDQVGQSGRNLFEGGRAIRRQQHFVALFGKDGADHFQIPFDVIDNQDNPIAAGTAGEGGRGSHKSGAPCSIDAIS